MYFRALSSTLTDLNSITKQRIRVAKLKRERFLILDGTSELREINYNANQFIFPLHQFLFHYVLGLEDISQVRKTIPLTISKMFYLFLKFEEDVTE